MDDVDAEEEILAEAALLDGRLEIAVGRGHEPHVERHLAIRADRAHHALLQRAQELRLQRQRQLADLVEEQRAAVRLQEEAGARAARVGEGAPRVTEELALEQRLGNRGAVDRDEGPRSRAGCCRCSARATSSLPVPLSPVTSTDASESATRDTRS